MSDLPPAIAANLKKAAFDRKTVKIGGGVFAPGELREAAELIQEAVASRAQRAQVAELLQAIIDEAGPTYGLDTTPGCINAMSRYARAALALVNQGTPAPKG